MAELPEPILPAEVDMRRLPAMLLDVNRVLASDTAVKARRNPAIGWVSFRLWCFAWRELPAGSLPADDERIAQMADVTPEVWEQIRRDVMRPWVKCRDGRVYHPVVCEKAWAAWMTQMEIGYQAHLGNAKKQRQRLLKGTATNPEKGVRLDPIEWLHGRWPGTFRTIAQSVSLGTNTSVPGDMMLCPPRHKPMSPGTRLFVPGTFVLKGSIKILSPLTPLSSSPGTSAGEPDEPAEPELPAIPAPAQPQPDAFDRWLAGYGYDRPYNRRAARAAWDHAVAQPAVTPELLDACRDAYLATIAPRPGSAFTPHRQSPERFLRQTWLEHRANAESTANAATTRHTEIAAIEAAWQPHTAALLHALDPQNTAAAQAKLFAFFRSARPATEPSGAGTLVLADTPFDAHRLTQHHAQTLNAILPNPVVIRAKSGSVTGDNR